MRILYTKSKVFLRKILRTEPSVDLDVRLQNSFAGSCYGGWTYSADHLDRNSIVYSFGVGEDISFDLDLIASYGLTVHAFDPTPQSINWVHQQKTDERFRFYNFGIGSMDGVVKFYPPENSAHVSHSTIRKAASGSNYLKVHVYRLQTILNRLKHDHIDLLKLDIEGEEYNVLEDILKARILPTQILVEFHHRFPEFGFKNTEDSIKVLRSAGYRLFNISPNNENFSFVRTEDPPNRV